MVYVCVCVSNYSVYVVDIESGGNNKDISLAVALHI